MKKRNNINVNEDFKNFLDILLVHVKEHQCAHSVNDLIKEPLHDRIVNLPVSDLRSTSKYPDRKKEMITTLDFRVDNFSF